MSERSTELKLTGRGLSPGLGRGAVYLYRPILEFEPHERAIMPAQVPEELTRLDRAVEQVQQDLQVAASRVEEQLNPELAEMFHAQELMLHDPTLRHEIQREIDNELINVEPVLWQVIRRWARSLRQAHTGAASEPADDLRDLGRRLLRALAGLKMHSLEEMPADSVLVTQQLLPSDTVHLSWHSTKGIIVEQATAGSHAVLISREIGIPLVAGIADVLKTIPEQAEVLLDGNRGSVVVNPGADAVAAFKKVEAEHSRRYRQAQERAREPAATRDGFAVAVLANVGDQEDVALAAVNGADGVGLYRIEQLCLAQKEPPTATGLYDAMRECLALMRERGVTARLLDIGGDKELPYLRRRIGDNPALGVRGVRFLLKYPELLRTQLRALVRLAGEQEIQILVPFVTLPNEMKQVRAELAKIAEAEGASRLPSLGAMIETPAAALGMAEFLPYADFFSIGTNDLTQYTLAASREDTDTSDYFMDDHPAVLHLVGAVMQAAGDKPVSLCGELAGRPETVATLIQHGLRALSVAPPLVPLIKEAVRQSLVRTVVGVAAKK